MRLLAALAAAVMLSGCTTGPAASSRPTPTGSPSAAPIVYAALGASETVGVGTDDPARQAFPQLVAAHLGPRAVLYNLGLVGETTAAALTDELPPALAAHPSVATVFFNVDDLAAGTSPETFEANLMRIVGTLRAQPAAPVVLVATTPPVDQLPVFKACAAQASTCPLKGIALPSADVVRHLVDLYNAATARVAAATGAIPVDLSAAGLITAQHPEYVAGDGLHPSTAGARALADAFIARLPANP
jgi:lysophospholipase L1-like esterase